MKLTARISTSALILLGIAVLAPTALHAGLAPATDVSGPWQLSSSCNLQGEEAPCVYEGSGNLVQDMGVVAGDATLMLISGPAACPAELMATVMGSVSGLTFIGTLDGGQLGILNFDSLVTPDGNSIDGTSMAPDGEPFQGTNCTWAAAQNQLFNPEIPTLNEVGLVLLVVLLLGGGLLVLRRRQGGGASA